MIKFGHRIPVAIHPIFWLVAGIIGWVNSWTLMGTLLWMVVILVSLLVHEFGHAITAKAFGQDTKITLVAMGGLTHHDGKKLKGWQDFVIVLMGPLAGIILFAVTYFIRSAVGESFSPVLYYVLTIFVFVNLFWTIVNLLPIMPLDGGQLLRIILEGIFGHRGLKTTLMIGIVIGVGLGIALFIYGLYLMGAILLLLSFESFASWNQVKRMTSQDRDEGVQHTLEEAQDAFKIGHLDQAKKMLESVRSKSDKGLLFEAATEQLAFIFDRQGDLKKVYEILKSIDKKLSLNGRRLLHKAAFYNHDYELTLTLGNRCFRDAQAYEIAYINALASANLKDVKGAIGWLECAVNHGLPTLEEALAKHEFDPIRDETIFQKFLQKHGIS